jgi:hypothetical protein
MLASTKRTYVLVFAFIALFLFAEYKCGSPLFAFAAAMTMTSANYAACEATVYICTAFLQLNGRPTGLSPLWVTVSLHTNWESAVYPSRTALVWTVHPWSDGGVLSQIRHCPQSWQD